MNRIGAMSSPGGRRWGARALHGRLARGLWGRAVLLLGLVGGLAAQSALADPNQVSVGSTLWVDANYNGLHDSGEPVIAGAQVELTGGNLASPLIQITDAEGNFRFAGLEPGQYHVRIPQSQLSGDGAVASALRDFWGTHGVSSAIAIHALSTKDSAVAADDNTRVDGDDDGVQSGFGTDVLSPSLTLTANAEPVNGVDPLGGYDGEYRQTPGSDGYAKDDLEDASGDMTVDFGFTHQCASICDTDQDGTVSQSDIDTINSRMLKAVTPGGAGTGNCSGSGRITGNDRLWCQAFMQFETGIGNRVWREVNDTAGFQSNEGDLPLEGVQVELIDDRDGHIAGTATTDEHGCYIIEGMPEGDYIARVPADQSVLLGLEGVAVDPDTTLAGADETTDDGDDQNGLQLGIDGHTETYNVFHLSPGGEPVGEVSGAACALATLPDASVNETADFAFKSAPTPELKVALGNQVWIEVNGTSGYQPGPGKDRPVAGATVQLRYQNGSLAATTDTDADGCYLFDDLTAGTYYVQIPGSQFGSTGVLYGYGPLPDQDASGGPANNYGDDQGIDDNRDQNGRPEQGATGNVVSNLFNLEPNRSPTGELGSACAGRASQLPDANVNLTADFSFEAKYAIGNLVWIDKNKQAGYQSATDQPVDDVVVELWNATTGKAVRSSTTASGGFYLFDQLSPGTYYVKIPASQFSATGPGPLDGYLSYADASPAGGDNAIDDSSDENGLDDASPELNGVQSAPIVLGVGSEPILESGAVSTLVTSTLPDENVDLTVDFGFVKSLGGGAGAMSIGSTIWVDVNYNGVHDQGEPVIPDVQVELSGGDLPFVLTQATDRNGNFLFADLNPGTYTVRILPTQLTGGGAVALALRNYWGSHGVSATIAIKALSTRDSTVAADDGNRVDGDDDGIQTAGYGTVVLSPPEILTFDSEPMNGSGANGERQQTVGSDGFALDDGADSNGDMTVDFGFTHQCATICDTNGDFKVDQTDIATINSRMLKSVTPGGVGTGNCSGSGRITGNDRLWCQAFIAR